MSEDGSEVVRVDHGIAIIPPFRVDIPTSSQGIRFGSKVTRAEPHNKVELGEVLGPSGLASGQNLRSTEILQILVISNHINR